MSPLAAETAELPVRTYGAIGAAMLASAALLWAVTGLPLVALAFAAGVASLVVAGVALARMRDQPLADGFSAPDWSVTVAAIDQSGAAIAITDRANRLTCANATYVARFGEDRAPPNLDLDTPGLEILSRLSRVAWRDGSSEAELSLGEGGDWQVKAERAGRGEDHIIWRFIAPDNAAQGIAAAPDLTGVFGAMLSQAGIETALVNSDGVITSVNAGFAHRASGDAAATMAGQEFVSLLRSDKQNRIYFAREGREGAPQTLVQVSLADPAGTPGGGLEIAPSLMLLLDNGVGIGGAPDGAGQAGVAQLEGLLGQLPLGLAMTDRDGRFLFGNKAFLRAIGREAKGLPPFPTDLVAREDKPALSDAVRRHGRGPSSSGDVAVRLVNNPEEPVSLGLAGVRGLGEAAVLLSLSDSSEETQLKRQVAQATKMQAVGQLAGGVAHDFNNVLTAIIGTCDLMALRHTPGDSDYDDIQQIRANSNRAASLTRQLLAFSRQQTLRPVVLQLPDVVSEVGKLIERLLGEKIEYNVRHDRDLGPVRADPQQLEQVIMNLAVNARDAIQARGDGTGRVSLATRRVSARDVAAMRSDILPPAEYTALVVSDSGGGIPEQALGKIFEPFFTTKESGKGGAMGGTGLGLSTVYGIIKQSGGFIFADNVLAPDSKQSGARFTIYLPVHRGAVPPKPEPTPQIAASDWSGGGELLLVEDEDMVRLVAERALARSGYTITACADGEEGLAAVANGGVFDLVVSDVVMPGMDGPAMARAIRKLQPELPVLFMSGYAEEQLRKDIDIPHMHFIPKPFSVQQISDKVAEVMRATPMGKAVD